MPESLIKTLLLATDLAPRTDRALERAASLARHWNAKLHLLSVIDGAAPLDDAGTAEAKHRIELVVAGTHGRTGLMNLLLGSVVESIIEKVDCDVLIAPSRGAWV